MVTSSDVQCMVTDFQFMVTSEDVQMFSGYMKRCSVVTCEDVQMFSGYNGRCLDVHAVVSYYLKMFRCSVVT